MNKSCVWLLKMCGIAILTLGLFTKPIYARKNTQLLCCTINILRELYARTSETASNTNNISSEINTLAEIVKNIEELESVEIHCPIILTQADFGTNGLEINDSGYYYLCEDIKFTTGSVTALSIKADYVTVDLNGKSISGAGLENGVVIDSGLHNIAIKHGTLADFDSIGIEAKSNAHHILLEDLCLTDALCDYALSFSANYNCKMTNCTVTQCGVKEVDTETPSVINMRYCSEIDITDCMINKNYNNSSSNIDLYILLLHDCAKCRFIGCHFDDNYDEKTDGNLIVVYAVSNETLDALLFDHCSFNSNSSLDELRGIYMINAAGSLIKECECNSNSASESNLFIGFLLTSSSPEDTHTNSVEDCTVSGNVGTIILSTGIFLGNQCGSSVLHCRVHCNPGIGIAVVGGNGCVIANCEANANAGDGVKIGSGNDHCIRDCIAMGNGVNGISDSGTNSVVYGCAAGANGGNNYDGLSAVCISQTGSTSSQTAYRYDNVTFESCA